MIIDADTHISNLHENNSLTAEELLSQLDLAGIDKAVTWIQPPYIRSELNQLLEYLYVSAKHSNGRLLPFGWADPHLGKEQTFSTIKKCFEEYGFYGVKLNGAQNEYPIDDDILSIPYIEQIAKYNGILAFHCGADVKDFTHPYRIERIAKLYPETRILMIHMGGASFADYSSAAIKVAQKCDNITLIGSAIRTQPLIQAIKILGPERVAYGSDAPFELPYIEIAKYKAIFEKNFSKKISNLVMGQTIANVLKLK